MNEKITFWKIGLISIFVFVFGYFMGNIFEFKNLMNLEGYEYNALEAEASSSNASPCNATGSNATSSNATSSNATSSNATSSNITPCTTTKATSSNATTTTPIITPAIITTIAPVTTIAPTQTVNNESVSFENSKITIAQIKEINDSLKPLNVTLNCDANTVVTSSTFDAIKKSNSTLVLVSGQNKMTFLGSNITESKDINFSVGLSEISTNDNLKKFGTSGLVAEFPNNKNLPGNALVSINIDPKYNSYFTNGTLAVYYYNETTDQLELVVNNLKITNNTIEFTIDHNSSYVLTSSTINQTKSTEVANNAVVKFVNNKLIYIVVIAVSIILIIAVTIIVFVQRKKKLGKMI
jgi:hypothetical protein